MGNAWIRVTYRLETAGDIAALAAKIASDQSTGTFTELPGETAAVQARCAARVEAITPLAPTDVPTLPDPGGQGPYNRADVVIAYPLEAVGTDIAALMTITVGGVFAVRGLSGIRVMDIDLPAAWSCHPGPQFGIAGSRRLMGVTTGPMIASIIKPSLGLLPDETAAVVAQLCDAGVDFIKDDEKLMNPGYSPLSDRIKAIMPVIDAHEQKTGKRVMYAFGISSADPDVMMRNHDMVVAAGGNAAVININSIGYGGMAFLRKRSGLCLHAHRNGWDVLTRHPGFGMEFRAYQKIWRLLGVDQFQINGIRAKYWEPDESFVRSFHAMAEPIFDQSDRALPVVCSGQWGGQAVDTYRQTGRTLDLMYLGGGGIHGHPMGAAAGVRAIRQAWDAAAADVELADYARDHRELAAALATWG
ncbi:ribulose-bisphosphate carboxylase large subunit family protein [Marinovum sp. 2_MG-2023]|uniref:3-oxo-isoapionate-4-phosphate decarboxylase OiaX n=1 Tax=unclassified Marinovum TaxID=2647166 RepID=UPI0026E4092A|nr:MULTISPECIES: 3-oxo-isoapionate-4-phosphate decarboxylase OiaX [unclassified Marinovum]MDO6731242.1 ribulose-bisphosphate carboxylase large subunit family protein [Marinovum sp. 2_MG-2023]MDO6780606.1 ribulose-bisphosphate carboxylase large subunit family protein [Marinovum sp. 1_MG-2023]